MPIVSILLPVYNGELYLDICIQSVLNQSFTDWELIIQDDCSQDNSMAIIQRYKDSRISYARNKSNQHIARNLNLALERARGHYIQLLGQDDRLLQTCLQEQLSFWKSNPNLGFTFFPATKIDKNGKQLIEASQVWDPQYKNTPAVCKPIEALLLFYNYGCLPGNISTVMFKRDRIEKVGMFDESYFICLDWDMWIRLATNYGFGFIYKNLVEIRSHPNQESSNPKLVVYTISETYRCLNLIEQALPSEIINDLRIGRQKKYGTNAINSAIQSLFSFQIWKAMEIVKIMKEFDSILLSFLLWCLEIPRKIRRKLSGRGRLEIRRAFSDKWFLEVRNKYDSYSQKSE